MKILTSFENFDRKYWIVIGLSLIVVVGILDYVTGPSLTFSAFYILPIALVTWQSGRRSGIAAAFLSTLVSLLTRVLSMEFSPQPVFYILNTLIEFLPLMIIVILLSNIRGILEREKELAQYDYLTGAMNSRTFYQFLRLEIRRSNRYKHAFTIAYFDIDDFKLMNDRFGHLIGDEVLRAVVKNARKHLRSTDVIARMGGDEFAVLLTETNDEAVQAALTKIQRDILEGMRQNQWEVTVSMGALTCVECIESSKESDELIRMVDNLMYAVKRGGKNAIQVTTFSGIPKYG